MGSQVKIVDFEIGEELSSELNSSLARLEEYCPDGTNIEFEANKVDERYEIITRVYTDDGAFTCRSFSTTFSTGVEELLDSLYDRIRSWRMYRNFLNVSDQQHGFGFANKNFESKRVLIVDDDPVSVKTLEVCLNKMGCATTAVTNGIQAIDEITKHDYDLVFLDWMMPDMTGGEALVQAERENSRVPSDDYGWSANRLPVIMYSSHSKSECALPELRHFRILGHWTKTLSMPDLVSKTRQTVTRLYSMGGG